MKALRIIAWGAAAWLFVAAALLLYVWPDLPQSPRQWALFIAFGPPIYALLELGGNWLFSERHGRAISNRSFSVARITLALFGVIAAIAVCWWLTRLFAQ